MMTCCAPSARAAPARVPDLEEKETTVLSTLAHDGDATIAFQGLRHRLDMHQQVLTRTLRRLERDGLVAKHEDGYRLAEDGFHALVAVARARSESAACPADACARGETLPLLHALLPPHADAAAFADALKGRWFKDLRWYGEARHADEITLTWLVAPDADVRVRVRIAGGAVTVEAEADDAVGESAFRATPALLGALADALGTEAERVTAAA